MTGKTPDVTLAQILALVTTAVGLLVSDQVIDGHTAKLITDVAAVVVPAAWMIADAIIRHGRSRAMLHQDPTR
jgi:hypothetical protein